VQNRSTSLLQGRQKVFDKQRYSIQIPQQWYVDKVEKYVVELKMKAVSWICKTTCGIVCPAEAAN
jgi:hypothetical protein